MNATLDELRAANPGVTISLVDETVFYTYGNYKSAIHTLLEGAALAVLVVLLFLRNWRATLIAAVALPLSAVPTFFVMDLLGFSLKLVSFLAITLATGILVDDAIVEFENIARHIRMGKSPYRAAIDAADEIGMAVIATTMTIVAVFVPVSFMPGIPGQYFSQFGMTVAISVLFSLLVARLITPMMAAYFMRAKDAQHEERDGFIMRGYLWLVHVTTEGRFLFVPRRYLTLVAAFAILIVSVQAMLRVPGSFLPPEDVSRIAFSVELPPGVTLEETDRTTAAMYELIRDVDGVQSIFILGGSSPTGERDLRRASVDGDPGPAGPHVGTPAVGNCRRPAAGGRLRAALRTDRPHPPAERDRGRNRGQAGRRARYPRVQAERSRRARHDLFDPVVGRGGSEPCRRPSGSGPAWCAGIDERGHGSALPRPEVQITRARKSLTPGRDHLGHRAGRAGSHHLGDVDAALAKLSVDSRLIPVRVRLTDDARSDLARISALRVPTLAGGSVPLNAVADIAIAEGPSVVKRLNRERIATIGANLPPGVALGTATAVFNDILQSVELPATVRIAESGDAEVQQELMGSFVNAMVFGLMLVLTVLILLFRSVIQPFTILLSLPLAIGGVAAALILTNSALSMPVLIGILMLMGIVTKNAILLIDFAIEMRQRGLDRYKAVIEAGHKRARPIVMTSIAMSAGMLPRPWVLARAGRSGRRWQRQ